MAWLSNYNYRRKITITSTVSSTDYQQRIDLDSSFTFTNSLLDGVDIRFTSDDGQTLLDYWVEDWGIDSAIIWVKIPSLTNGDTVIYMYYGDDSVADGSSGDDVFIFFDDFPGSSLDTTKWQNDSVYVATWNVSGSVVSNSGDGGICASASSTKLNLSANIRVRGYLRITGSSGNAGFYMSPNNINSGGPFIRINDTTWEFNGVDISPTITNDEGWHTAEMAWNPTNSSKGNVDDDTYTTSSNSYGETRYAEVWQYGGKLLEVDWIFVASYLGSEPIVVIDDEVVNWYGSWYKRIKISIDNTNIDTNLEDFPVTVRLSTTSGKNSQDVTKVFDHLETSTNRRKIIFVGDQPMYAEIEKWDHGNEAIIHVKVPTVYASKVSELYMYYDRTKNSGYTADTSEVVPGHKSDDFVLDTQQDLLSDIDFGWSILNESFTSYVNSDITNRGKLTISHNTENSLWDDATNGFFAYKSFTGDFDVQIQFSDNASAHEEGLGLYAVSGSDWYGIVRKYVTDVYGSGIEIDVVNTVGGVSSKVYTNESINDVFFRLVRSGDIFTAYSKAGSGDSWVQRDSRTRSDIGSTVNVGIGTQTGNTDGNYVAKVEYFYAQEVVAQYVWDGDFEAVYHLHQDPSGGSNSILDSTQNINHGTPYNFSAGDLIDTLIGKGYRFAGSDEWIGVGDVFYSDELTVEAVIKTNDTNKKMLVHKTNVVGAVTAGDNEWELYAQSNIAYFKGYDTQSTTVFSVSTDANLNTSDFFYIAGSTTGITGYADADITLNNVTSSPVNPVGAMRNVGSGIQIGSRSNADDNTYFDGDITEIRLSKTYRTAAWRKATYYSIFDELLSFDDEETIVPSSTEGISDELLLYDNLITQLVPLSPTIIEPISVTEKVVISEVPAVIRRTSPLAVAFINSVSVGSIGTDKVYITVVNDGETTVTILPRFRNSYFVASPTSTSIEPDEIVNFSVFARPYLVGLNKDTMYFKSSSGAILDDTVLLECIGTSVIDVINPIFPISNDVNISHNAYIRFRTTDLYGLYRDHITVIINDAIVISQGQFTEGWSGDISIYGTNNWDVTINGPDSWGFSKLVTVNVYVINYLGQRGLSSYSFTTKEIGEQEWGTSDEFLNNIRQNPSPTYYLDSILDGNLEANLYTKQSDIIPYSIRPYRGINFNGSTSYITLGSWDPGNKWTIEAWFRIFEWNDTRCTVFGGMAISFYWALSIDSNGYIMASIRSAAGSNDFTVTDKVAVPGTIYHGAVTFDGYEINIFVDGERLLTSHDVEIQYTGNTQPRIGGEQGYSANDFNGDIWDVRFWNYNRTIEEIQGNLDKKLTGTEYGLYGLWRLVDGLEDATGNNDGTGSNVSYTGVGGEVESEIIAYTEEVNFSALDWDYDGYGDLTFQVAVINSLESPNPNDSFGGGIIDTSKWEILYGTPYISSGVLRCDVESGSSNNEGVESVYYLTGDFDIQIDYDLVSGPATLEWDASLRVIDVNGNIVKVDRRYNGSHRYGVVAYNGVTSSWDTSTVTSTSDTSGKLRLVREGSVVTGYYWTGSDWTEIGNRTIVGDNRITIQIVVENSNSNPATSVGFDNFVCNSGTVELKWNYIGHDNTSLTYFDKDNKELSSLSGKYFRYKVYIPAMDFESIDAVRVSVFSYWQVKYDLYHQKVLRQAQVDRLSYHSGVGYRLQIRTSKNFSSLSTALWSDWVSGFDTFPYYVIFDLEPLYLLCNVYEIKVEIAIDSTLRVIDGLEAETIQNDNLRQYESTWITGDYPTFSLSLEEGWEVDVAWNKEREITLTSAANYVIDNLDGDTDKMYMILLYGYVTSNSADHVIGIRPNGDTITGNYGRGIQMVANRESGTTFNSAAGWNGGTEAILPLGHTEWNDHGRFMARGIINADSSVYRMIRSEWTFVRNGYDDYLLTGHASNMWEDASTNITFLTLHFDGANNFNGKLILFSLRV